MANTRRRLRRERRLVPEAQTYVQQQSPFIIASTIDSFGVGTIEIIVPAGSTGIAGMYPAWARALRNDGTSDDLDYTDFDTTHAYFNPLTDSPQVIGYMGWVMVVFAPFEQSAPLLIALHELEWSRTP